MFEAFRMLIAIVLVTIALAIVPAMRSADKFEDEMRNAVEVAVKEFVDITKSRGYIDPRDYLIFMDKLDASGGVFNITIEHYKKRYQPIYGDPNNYYTFTDKFEIIYEGYFNREILNKLFPNNGELEDSATRRYEMNTGDLFYVRVEQLGVNMSSVVKSFIYDKFVDVPFLYSYGGMVM